MILIATRPIELRIEGRVHLAHAAVSEHGLDAVAAECRTHHHVYVCRVDRPPQKFSSTATRLIDILPRYIIIPIGFVADIGAACSRIGSVWYGLSADAPVNDNAPRPDQKVPSLSTHSV